MPGGLSAACSMSRGPPGHWQRHQEGAVLLLLLLLLLLKAQVTGGCWWAA